MKTELCDLFYKYGSDKCPSIFHSYSPDYYDSLKDHKTHFSNILEIGVGTNEIMKPIVGERYQVGASLKAWRDFFDGAWIYGLDINTSVLFEEERIKCFYTDQSNSAELAKTVEQIRDFKEDKHLLFDLIIDDGSHLVQHMILTFNTLHKYLSPGGLYIIEDIKLKEIDIFRTLAGATMELIKVHDGVFEWDSFIIYRRMV